MTRSLEPEGPGRAPSPSVRQCQPRQGGAPGWGRPDPDFGSGVGSPAKALELAPKTLAGPALAPDGHDPRSNFSHDRRRAVVHVARCGDGSSDTRLDRSHDLHNTLAICDQRLYPIACANPRRRLCRRPIDTDVTALAQSRRKRAGLHQAHRAEPAIDACLRRGTGISHVSRVARNGPTGAGLRSLSATARAKIDRALSPWTRGAPLRLRRACAGVTREARQPQLIPDCREPRAARRAPASGSTSGSPRWRGDRVRSDARQSSTSRRARG